jgi:putative sterol carrier protein
MNASQRLKALFAEWSARIQSDKEAFGGEARNYLLEVGEERWALRLGDNPALEERSIKVTQEVPEGRGCIVTSDEETFLAMASKDLNPQVAYMEGKLRISGKMADALYLYRFFR